MYAMCVGVRNRFFSLSCIDDSPEEAIQRSKDVQEAWLSSYKLDPSWDERLNGQGNNSLVWCRDGANVLTQEHFQHGFFMLLVKESKDSEIRLWSPVSGSTRFVCVDLSLNGYGNGLRMVRPFWGLNTIRVKMPRKRQMQAYDDVHLNWWTSYVFDEHESDYFTHFDTPLSFLPKRKTHDLTNH